MKTAQMKLCDSKRIRQPKRRHAVTVWLVLMMVLGWAAVCSATTLNLTVAAGADDADEVGTGGTFTYDNTGGFLQTNRSTFDSGTVSSGFRFSGVTVPKGATINSATFKPYITSTTYDDLYCTVYGHASDNSEDFATTQSIKSRTRTTATTAIGADAQLAGYKSYNVTTIVQEIVNRSGWGSGNALSLLLIANTGSVKNTRFYAYEYGSYPAQLVIDYTVSPNLTQAHYRWRNDDGYEQSGSDTVAVDAVNTYSTTGSNKTTSATISHTVSGNNRLLLVGVNMWPGGSGNYVTSVTYGGVSLAKITDVSRSTSIRTELWKLVAPAAGTANVVVNITGSPNQNTFLAVGTISFTGVDQSTPYRTPATTGTGNGTSASVTVSSATGEMVLSVAGAGTSSYNFTSITGGTERWNLSAATSTKAAAGTAPGDTSVTISHGLSNTNDWAIIGLAIKPASLTGATWAANEDTQLSGLTKSTTKRLRFLVSNTGSGNSSGATYQLQAAQAATCSSGTYAAVPTDTSGTWKIADTTYYADGAASANVATGLTDPGGKSFVAGQLKDTGNTTGSIALTTSQFTEIEYAVQATDNAGLGLPYCFRLYDTTAGAALNTYTVYAQATLESMSLTQAHYRWRNDDGGEGSGYQTIQVANSYNGTMSNATTLTISNVAASGSSRVLLVGISWYAGSVYPVQSVSWNGQSLSQYGVQNDNGMWASTAIYYLVAPAVATSNVTITFSSATYAVAGALALTGVDQNTPLGNLSFSSGSSSPAFTSVTTTAGDLVFAVVGTLGGALSSFTGDTQHWYQTTATEYGAGGTKLATGNPTSFQWTVTSTMWVMSAIAVKRQSYTAATFAVAEDTKVGVAKLSTKRVRLTVANGAASSTGALQYQLQVAKTATCASGSYGAVGSSTDWQMADSSYFANGDSTSNVSPGLTDPGGSFTAGRLNDTTDTTSAINIAASGFTEVEFAVQATNNATSGGDYCFRLYNSTSGAVLNTYTNYAQARVNGVTAINLLSFAATGDGENVGVRWSTAQESENKGFNLYRAQSLGGPYVQLNAKLIPSGSIGGEGRDYEFMDPQATPGALYYYRLEDVDVGGAVTPHGPVCVDWDGDGIPDDYEKAYGLNPGLADAELDSDGDGVPNWLEYARGTNPQLRDTDGDGVADGAERKTPGYSGGAVSGLSAEASVQVLAADAGGMIVELLTPGFDVTAVVAGGQSFERLRLPAYVHGFTLTPGWPQMPVKGVLVELPAGRSVRLTVLETDTRVLSGYRIYPAPEHRVGAGNRVVEEFCWDEAAYRVDAVYPAAAAELSGEYLFREQAKQRLLLYPLQFNPASGELVHHARIRVRVEFEEAPAAPLSERMMAAAPMSFMAPSPATGWAPPAGTAYKLSTNGEGIYRITRAELLSAGIAASDIDALNLARVQLFYLGSEQAIAVYDQNADHVLDPGDAISFYAPAVPADYAKYARYNCFWLIDAGSAGPLRMATVDGTPAGGPLAVSHVATVHHELDQTYLQSARGADGMDRWIFSSIAMGAGFAGGGLAKSFSLQLPGALATGDLSLRLYSPYELAHATTVAVNGSDIGTAAWSGIGWTEAAFAAVSLLDGANTVSLLCTGALDKTAVDWFEVSYARNFAAAGDSLKFTHAGGARYQLSGFTTNDVQLFDISDPWSVQRVVNGTFGGGGPYSFEAEPCGAAGSATYLAVASAALKAPASIVKDRASALASSANAADWILITHRSLGWDGAGAEQGWVTSLVALRQSQGLRTAVVDVEDIFDEFGYGLPTPQAIKDFIAYAYANWQPPAPQYVLLVGDTSYDYKDNWGGGTVNFVPGYLIYTTHLGETITDDWLVQVSGTDAVADLYIGRLPANSPAQAAAMVSKIVAYETAANSKGWERTVVLAADNQAEGWEAVFETMSEDAAALLPTGMATPERFYLQEYENESLAVTDLTADLLAAIDAGALIVNYAGHGSISLWATERILDNRGGAYRTDVADLANGGMYPFVVNMSCLTGYFIYPQTGAYAADSWRSLAEGFMWKASGGAVAALMPSGMTDTDGQQLLSNALYEGIFALDRRTLGPAVAYAKEQLLANGSSAYEEIANTFLLFGDPATALKVPLPRRPLALTAQRQGATAVLGWGAALDCDGHAVAGYHVYRRQSTESSYTRLTTAPLVALTYTDTTLPAGSAASWYYAIAAVDTAGDESVKSPPATVTTAPDSGAAAGGGGGCFIAAAAGPGGSRDISGGVLLLVGVICVALARGVHACYLPRRRRCQ